MRKKILELVMIVKNSGEVLRYCLQENKKWIDHWTIVDTGSIDNTIDIIKEELKDIPGNLYQEEFIDFSQARNKSLELSYKTCQYQIILDDSYVINGGEELRNLLEKSEFACHAIKIGNYENGFLNNDYFSKRIVKSSENLTYKYRLHEHIVVEEDKTHEIENINIFINDIKDQEHRLRTYNRHKKDIEFLLLDYEENPNDPRTLYFLAFTSFLLDRYDDSLKYYELLRKLNNIGELYLFSSIYESICIQFLQNNNEKQYEIDLLKCAKQFINRAEPGYKLVILYRDTNRLKEAEKIIDHIINFKKPKVINTVLESDIYEYGIQYLYVEIKLLVNKDTEAIRVLKELLKRYPLNQELLNIRYSLSYNSSGKNILNISSTKLSEDKTLVIHIGDVIKDFDPNKDLRISGSEYMAINLATEFSKLHYRVFIFGSFENKEKNINFEGIYNGVQYIDYKYFNEFALRYIIDYLIISRFTCNLVYYDNIKNVYLWVHDILPDNTRSKGLQRHKDKFKKIIGISNWQKEYIINKLNIPKEYIYVSRNAIYNQRFLNKNIKKNPYRFIYSSYPDRGLNYLIDMIPKIKEKYIDTTLYIFCNKTRIDKDTLNKIENLDYIYLHPRINQNELAIEFLKSDIWLYPTNFQETYCITVLEAMASKTFIATVNYAGLGEIVEGKGIACDAPIEENLNVLLNKLYFVLERPILKEYLIEKAYEWAMEQTYEKLTHEWINNLF
jgi:hypothetical protein